MSASIGYSRSLTECAVRAASVTKKREEGAVVTLQAALPDKLQGQPSAYVVAPQGLFPAPLHHSEEAKGKSWP